MTEPVWTGRGKTVAALIKGLQTFEDQSLEVRISIDGGGTSLPISLVGKSVHEGKTYAILRNAQEVPTPIRHGD
jgi:hypothetical protein